MEFGKESGRVSAMKLTRFLRDKKEEETVYIPQFEYITYKPSTGETIESKFLCIVDKNNVSGLSEFKDEIDALKFAIKYRNSLEF